MSEKLPDDVELLKQMLPYLVAFFLSCWGGVVHHIQRLQKSGKAFSWRDFCFDLLVSSFAGLLTYFLCDWAHIQGPIAALLIAVSGHMGTRSIASFYKLHDKIFDKVR